jgi:hypothetical protein
MQNEERINLLEKQIATLKKIVYGFGCLLVAGVIVSATSLHTIPDVIQAKKFEVLSEDGTAVVVLNSHIIEANSPLYTDAMQYGSITSLNSDGRTLVMIGASPCTGTGQLLTMNAHGRLLVKLGAEFQKKRYGVVGNGGLIETYQENGTLTSYCPQHKEQPFHDPYNAVNNEDTVVSKNTVDGDSCCLHLHHLECIVNTTSALPGDCQHAHHAECGRLLSQ